MSQLPKTPKSEWTQMVSVLVVRKLKKKNFEFLCVDSCTDTMAVVHITRI